MLPGLKTQTNKHLCQISAIMQIFSHRLSTIRESRKIPGSQFSYMSEYTDGAAIMDNIVYADGATVMHHI